MFPLSGIDSVGIGLLRIFRYILFRSHPRVSSGSSARVLVCPGKVNTHHRRELPQVDRSAVCMYCLSRERFCVWVPEEVGL